MYDYGFRIYNPRIGKFLSVDPLTKSYPWLTPYQFASNRPIVAIDLDGLESADKNVAGNIESDPNRDLLTNWYLDENLEKKETTLSTFTLISSPKLKWWQKIGSFFRKAVKKVKEIITKNDIKIETDITVGLGVGGKVSCPGLDVEASGKIEFIEASVIGLEVEPSPNGWTWDFDAIGDIDGDGDGTELSNGASLFVGSTKAGIGVGGYIENSFDGHIGYSENEQIDWDVFAGVSIKKGQGKNADYEVRVKGSIKEKQIKSDFEIDVGAIIGAELRIYLTPKKDKKDNK